MPTVPHLNVTDGRTDRQTDRQTDGRTDGRTTYDNNTALSLRASRGKGRCFHPWLISNDKKFAALLLIGMASPYQILDWYGGRHTCHTASGALASPSFSLLSLLVTPLNLQWLRSLGECWSPSPRGPGGSRPPNTFCCILRLKNITRFTE